MKNWEYTLLSFTLLMSVSFPAEAVYPVRDSENILQQAKNYAESIKIVTEATKTALDTANLVKNSILQLSKLPQDFINAQVGALNAARNTALGTIKDIANPNKYVQEIFPEMRQEDVLKDLKNMGAGKSLLEINVAVIETKQAEDQKVIEAEKKSEEIIKKIHEENDKARQEINKLVEKAKTAAGQNQLAQINIAINGWKASIDANMAQEKLVKDQLENVKDQAAMNKAKAEQEGIQANARAQNTGVDGVVNALKEEDSEPYNRDFTAPSDEKAFWK